MNGKQTSGDGAWVDPDDAPELTPEHFERADVYEGEKLIRRGRPPTTNAKQLVSLRLDQDVLRRLRAGQRSGRDESGIHKKAPDLAARRALCDQTRGRGRKLGGNQARMNKQYSGQSWRSPRPE